MKQQDSKKLAGFRKLSEDEFDKINDSLKTHSAICSGGSQVWYTDGSTEIFIGVDTMGNYSREQLGDTMKRIFGCQEVVLNGLRD